MIHNHKHLYKPQKRNLLVTCLTESSFIPVHTGAGEAVNLVRAGARVLTRVGRTLIRV